MNPTTNHGKMPNHHSFIPADHRYVSTSTSNKPQTPDISASPVASALQAAAHVVEWAAEELGIPEMAGKMKDSKEVEKEWRESPHKSGLIASEPSRDYLLNHRAVLRNRRAPAIEIGPRRSKACRARRRDGDAPASS